jgi:ketosteroid isomerase-like protein
MLLPPANSRSDHRMVLAGVFKIAPIVDRSPPAARQLASRRVQEQAPVPDADLGRQREVVDAFLAASREGDFEALLEVLVPDVVLRADAGTTPTAVSREVQGAQAVAELALAFSQVARFSRPALVNGTVGLVTVPGGELFSDMSFTVKGSKIVEIDILADAARLTRPDGPRRLTLGAWWVGWKAARDLQRHLVMAFFTA